VLVLGLAALSLAGCNRAEEAHQVRLKKGGYAGEPMPALDPAQVSALERRASNENY
jgi:hypothetical protein